MPRAADGGAAGAGKTVIPARQPSELWPTELWLVDLQRSAAALLAHEQTAPRLSDDDWARCERGPDADHRRERLASHIVLRVLIERVAGTGWRQAPYRLSPTGKPFLPGSEVAFSLAHVAGRALVAVGRIGPLGVDLERRRPVSIDPQRRAALELLGQRLVPDAPLPGEPEARFLQAWVRLEACVKATGEGVAAVMAAVADARPSPIRSRSAAMPDPRAAHGVTSLSSVASGETEALVVRDLALGAGLYAAVAGPPLAMAGPVAVNAWPETESAIAALAAPPTPGPP